MKALFFSLFLIFTNYSIAMDQDALNNKLFDAVSSKKDLPGKIMLLLALGANPNAQKFDPPLEQTVDYDNYNDTPLHIATRNGYLESIELLLQENANPNIQNLGNYTALHEAIYLSEDIALKIIDALYECNANFNMQDEHGNTPLFYAIKYKKFKIADKLIKYGALKDKQNKKGNTILHETILDKNSEGFKYLLLKGAATFLENKNKQTLFDLALEIEDIDDSFALILYDLEE